MAEIGKAQAGAGKVEEAKRTFEEAVTIARNITKPPLYLDEIVQFTVYRPATVQPQKWYPLLAFAHLSERRTDAPEDEAHPLEEKEKQARQYLGELLSKYSQSTQESSSAVPQGGEITFKPFIEGVEFNPLSRSFRWEECVHREEFKLRASSDLDGKTARGWLRVYLGPLILAQVNLAIKVDSRHVATNERQATAAESARPLRKVFASYSHEDRAIVEEIEEHLRHAYLGIEYLRDATKLRAGEVWSPRLMEMIKEANAFQLFWSTNSMRSDFVREEYQYALSLGREYFVLPVYWETPFPEKPEENLPPEELRRLHFEKLAESTIAFQPSAQPTILAQPCAGELTSTEDTAELVSQDPMTLGLAAPADALFREPAKRQTADLTVEEPARSRSGLRFPGPSLELTLPQLVAWVATLVVVVSLGTAGALRYFQHPVPSAGLSVADRYRQQQQEIDYWNQRIAMNKARWSPEMRETFDRNMRVIDAQIADALRELNTSPHDKISEEKLNVAYNDKIKLLKESAQL